MKPARALGAAVVTLAAGLWGACAFPSPSLVDLSPGDAAREREAGPADAVTSADGAFESAAQEGGADATPVFDAEKPPLDATMIDGDATVVTPDGQVVNCDEDNDLFAKIGGSCGGLDCDDSNGNVRPNQDYNTLSPLPGAGAGKNGDWNCNGEVEVRGDRGVDPACPGLAATGCAKEGYVAANPACGAPARFVKCTVSGLFCANTFDQALPVACR